MSDPFEPVTAAVDALQAAVASAHADVSGELAAAAQQHAADRARIAELEAQLATQPTPDPDPAPAPDPTPDPTPAPGPDPTPTPTPTPDPAAPGVQAVVADSFVDTIGVCVHLDYSGVYTEWTDGARTRDRILELGVRNLRNRAMIGGSQGQRDSVYYQRMRELAAAGVRMNLTTQAYGEGGRPVTDWSQLAQIPDWTGGGVRTLEGQNEPPSGQLVAARAGNRALWQAVQGSPDLADVKVVGSALVFASSLWSAYVGGPGIDGDRSKWDFDPAEFCDYGNWHPYPGAVTPTKVGGTHDHVPFSMRDAKMYGVGPWNGQSFGDNGFFITECDYTTALAHGPRSHYPISPAGQGRYVLREFFEYHRMGYARSFAYELMDQGADNSSNPEMNFGWCYRDGTPKPAYTAVRNLISLLGDPGPAFTPGKLDYTIAGGDADVRHTLLAKRDGSFWLAIWQDKSVWDRV